ncbi:fibrillin-1-like isoform X2 [Oncorhynchus masou masou]|uniref:fibrillin-1-like isoform X2 n=1 Tax=Oncorhynchus masou masou TaxID=90313 RepID=UPI00318364EB
MYFLGITVCVSLGLMTTGGTQQCLDIEECVTFPDIFWKWGTCLNQVGSYLCTCPNGFRNSGNGQTPCVDIDECNTDGVCGNGGIFQNLIDSYWCQCPAGFTNFGKNQAKCVELNCDQYETQPGQTLPGFDSLSLLRNNCLVLSNSMLPGPTRLLPTGDVLLTGSGQLSLVMWVGVFVALTCVVLSLITTLWCRFVSRKRRGGRRLQQEVQLHRK